MLYFSEKLIYFVYCLYLCGIKSIKIMAENITIVPNQSELETQFEFVNSLIERYRSSAIAMVNTTALQMYWEIGQYISLQLKSARWGTKVVGDLADYLKRQNPRRRGLSKRNLYNMVKFDSTFLVNHKITPFALANDGRAWLAMCVVSLSSHSEPGHIEFHKKGDAKYCEYSLDHHRWILKDAVTLRPQEKQVLILSAQGYTVAQIADKMCRSVDTIKTYKRLMFERLGTRSITEALTLATNSGLI